MRGIGSTSWRILTLLPGTPIELVAQSIELLPEQAATGVVPAPSKSIAIDQPELSNALPDGRKSPVVKSSLSTHTLDDVRLHLTVILGYGACITPQRGQGAECATHLEFSILEGFVVDLRQA